MKKSPIRCVNQEDYGYNLEDFGYRPWPGASEWYRALVAFSEARANGTATEAHRQRVRETWLEVESRTEMELDDEELELMNEVLSSLQ